eukprot:XP_001706521.1 Hypothetical protein GL50803_33507 [Giardia lamblia ATCC 50803]
MEEGAGATNLLVLLVTADAPLSDYAGTFADSCCVKLRMHEL